MMADILEFAKTGTCVECRRLTASNIELHERELELRLSLAAMAQAFTELRTELDDLQRSSRIT
jgi:hypothetical protein